MALSSRNRRDKEDRIGESQPFRERTLSHQDKIRPGRESNPRPSAYKAKSYLIVFLNRVRSPSPIPWRPREHNHPWNVKEKSTTARRLANKVPQQPNPARRTRRRRTRSRGRRPRRGRRRRKKKKKKITRKKTKKRKKKKKKKKKKTKKRMKKKKEEDQEEEEEEVQEEGEEDQEERRRRRRRRREVEEDTTS
ncbi:hypothetical protein M8J77_009413 [Diaphorina citri]|nr:hypothetical protein M8J77_009413 [Diaphorina citri]